MDVIRTSLRLAKKASLALIASTAFGTSALAGTDIVTLEIPNIPGDANFAAQYGLPGDVIEVFSVTGGFSQSVSIGSGAGGGSGKVTFDPITVSKHFGASSPAILLSVATGTAISQPLVLNFYHVSRSGMPKKYFTIQLKDVFITSDKLTDSESRHELDDLETLSLEYAVISLTDVPSGNSTCWDRTLNRRC